MRILRTCIILIALAYAVAARAEPMPADAARAVDALFVQAEAPAMIAAVVDGERTYIAGFGEVRPGTDAPPDGDTLVRINSLTKVMTGEILATLATQGRLRLDDPLQRYAPPHRRVPRAPRTRAITLRDLAAHTAGLPRDLPPGIGRDARWTWLERLKPAHAPGVAAEYSNAGYTFLGDALAKAANKSYATLLDEIVVHPLGLADTTLTPTAEQCARLMRSGRENHTCAPTRAIAAMGGACATANDMARWMRAHLSAAPGSPRAATHAPLVERGDVERLVRLDMAGEPDAIAMGWLAMRLGRLPVLQKTGGGGGFMNYVILAPTKKLGLFVTVDRVDIPMLRRLTVGANALMTELAREDDAH